MSYTQESFLQNFTIDPSEYPTIKTNYDAFTNDITWFETKKTKLTEAKTNIYDIIVYNFSKYDNAQLTSLIDDTCDKEFAVEQKTMQDTFDRQNANY